ncbi:MAG: tRNA uridine-5-carboxymethylaminomethyl(34) synthesis GTPase MnmE [Pseudanabaena sp. M135S2SP2A07QC]|jgi:tRNA modification GTPase|nr:tRNA uridine-5-carboxymethylaminomethyl(34) synthesis GTPase MnmE [Pseudanabaena sp. M090S1SP2A07QC]MCA6507775.1 tRNA uridine-5-carboxymethylaminomethyl(34) synthesis GTPase MnmE [Pseudanabaena sp. M172S2SP2A07QC]MCA6521621.1 tRNA uridine-5-carboxymethylaminomethyl(34) synthesis GTPase MnmE [Pseudanabaena sp. M051S1SP2A07QC]MCA6524877.1 tRNA uridine-5-carboxymethylaminomethyl(34) synthesis GTPase MnmE [Pseudanabaena sp. M179S2SP2A07QC]MCA6530458.1 tRNA uridine-5-carboxymethylaminomethyl(34) 
MSLSDTIAAIATAISPQQGSVGIVRLSGDRAIAIAQQIFDAGGKQVWESHRILYGYVKQPLTKAIVDESLLLLMKSPRSFTREDVVEFHCHGGIMAVQQVLNLCLEQGARLAEAGEFSLRAFLNGRIDLTQAESINDLVGAKSAQAAQAAIASLRGKLAQSLKYLRSKCLNVLTEIEARIDFEDDLPPLDVKWVKAEILAVSQESQQILVTADRGELLRTGLKVAIVGRPNVGKSSLLNAWSRSDRAIVTDLPGTTRDVVDSQLVVGGIPIQVLDTAGIRETEDVVEKIGVERSRQAAQSADLVLMVIDASVGWIEKDTEIYATVCDRPVILVMNKIDLALTPSPSPMGRGEQESLTHSSMGRGEQEQILIPPLLRERGLVGEGIPIVKTAASQQQGIEDLEAAILRYIHQDTIAAANLEVAINQRQKACLLRVVQSLANVQIAIADQLPLDFWTIDLRDAISAIGEITGEEVTESVLDQIFSRFCIGK